MICPIRRIRQMHSRMMTSRGNIAAPPEVSILLMRKSPVSVYKDTAATKNTVKKMISPITSP